LRIQTNPKPQTPNPFRLFLKPWVPFSAFNLFFVTQPMVLCSTFAPVKGGWKRRRRRRRRIK
jgi:hypothetical protein